MSSCTQALPAIAPEAEGRSPAARTGMYRIAFRRNGMLRFGKKSLTAAILLGSVATALLAFEIGELPRQQREALAWVAHTLEALGKVATLEADLSAVASEGRGFVIANSTEIRKGFNAAALRADSDLADLRAITADNPAQQAAIAHLAPLVAIQIKVLREIVDQVEISEADGALRAAQMRRGEALMSQILAETDVIKGEEKRLLDVRSKIARRAAGRTTAALVTCGVLVAASGLFVIVLLVARGRERRHLNELQETNAALERLARHLTRARDEAERASLAKSRFLSGMSHELRTPLNGILGYAQLLRLEGGLSTMQGTRVDAMLDAGRHLLEMINRVLDLSEIETESAELQASEIDLHQVTRACIDLMRPAADAKGLALSMAVAEAMPRRLTTDTTRLRQVLLNLLGNAIKFTAQGSVGLRLRMVEGEDTLRIEVVDTGPGIPTESSHRLFQEFERLGAENSIEGAGLGLALSARLATMLGGRLGHEDNPGGGSVFWLELPLIVQNTAEPVPDAALSPGMPYTQLATTPPLRVLVADDMAMNRDIAGAFLRAAGHTVACVQGGAEAVEAAGARDFDVVLMDVRMPEVDGLEAARRIRALKGLRAQVPIVALTAQAFAEQVTECRQAGMDGHLAKPFTPEALLAVVARAAATGGERPVLVAEAESATSISTPGSEIAVLDLAAFERTAAFLAPEAVASYLRTIAERGEALLRQLRALDALAGAPRDLAEKAHTLAGSAGMFGFERLATVARQFEHAVQSGASEVQVLAYGLAPAIESSLLEIHSRVPDAAIASATKAAASQATSRRPVGV